MSEWLATSPYATALKSFVVAVLSLAVADFVSAGRFDITNWQTWLIAALASTLPVLVNAINPKDTRYGRGSK